jgi:hypothetical protein
MQRVVAPETLDHLAADDPAAMQSRADLRRVHRAMGTRGLLVRRIGELLATANPGQQPLRVLELGAGDGSLMLGVARELAQQGLRAELTLLDRLALLDETTSAAYAATGWSVATRVGDVLDWAASVSTSVAAAVAAGEPPERWDLIVANLFLHHFEGAQLVALLSAVAASTPRFLACEPHRGRMALAGSHLVGLLGARAVTREDAVLSVHAGFRERELTAAWPAPPALWRLRENGAGLFSHCFSAQRIGGGG